MDNSPAEQNRIEFQAAQNRLDHLYCGDAPPKSDYWAARLFYGPDVETGNPSSSFNSGAMGLGPYLSNVWARQLEIMKQQEPISTPSSSWWGKEEGVPPPTPTDTPGFEFSTTPPGGGDVIRNPSPDEDFWGQRYDPSLLLPSGWMDAVYKYLAEKEAEKPGGGVPVNSANSIKNESSKVVNTANAIGEVGKDAAGIVNIVGNPDPDLPLDPSAWLLKNIGMPGLVVGGFILLILMVK